MRKNRLGWLRYKVFTRTINAKRQLTIPVELFRAWDVQKGTSLRIEIEGDHFMARVDRPWKARRPWVAAE